MLRYNCFTVRFVLGLAAIVALMLVSSDIMAQIPIKHAVRPAVAPDSADVANAQKRHFWRASAEVVGFNVGLWAIDRYIQHGDWSYISFNTIKENFRHGFIWDNDNLGTNTFAHPYNGSIFYNAGRSNGFNYWQSELFAIGGSAMWELFMECEYPSTNDIIATPIGGAVIGEVLYRASDMVLDNRATGGERAGREIAGFIINPMRGINRLVTGQMWRHSSTSGRHFGLPNIFVRASAGLRTIAYAGNYRELHSGVTAQLDIEYGDRFEVKSTKPYDYFTISATVQAMKSQPVLTHMSIKGRLLARELLEKKRTHASIGLYQHFDFFDSDTIDNLNKRGKPDLNPVPYKLGVPASFGAGFMFRDIERHKWVLDAYAHANVILLGSVLSDHYWTDWRNYNWASGFSLKGGINFVWNKDKFSLSLNHEYYRLFTWKGYPKGLDLSTVDFHTLDVMGDKSVASFNATEARLDVQVWRNIYLTAIASYYRRSSHYRDFPDVKSTTADFKLMASYKF